MSETGSIGKTTNKKSKGGNEKIYVPALYYAYDRMLMATSVSEGDGEDDCGDGGEVWVVHQHR